MFLTFTQSWTRSETVQTRVGLLTDDPLEVKVVPVAPPSSRAVTRLPRLLTAVTMTPDRTDD